MTRSSREIVLGDRSGSLVIIREVVPAFYKGQKIRVVECLCDCGNKHNVRIYNFWRGSVMSCGCKRNDIGSLQRKHGLSHKSRLYTIWAHMRRRCFSPANSAYKWYGARGISVCQEWDEFSAFFEWANSSGYSDELTLERNDVNKNYCPENCSWIPLSQQMKNTRRSIIIEHNGKRMCARDWAKELGIKERTLYSRIQKFGVEYTVARWN